jgi:type VI protein secretion system component VasK
MKPYVRVTALVLGALFLVAAAAAAVELWREGDLFANPKLKPAAAWLMSGVMFLVIGLRGLWRRRKKPSL